MNCLTFEREPRAPPTDINLYKCSVYFVLFPYRKILLSKILSGHCRIRKTYSQCVLMSLISLKHRQFPNYFLSSRFCIVSALSLSKEYWIISSHHRPRYYMLSFFLRVAIFYFQILHAKFVLSWVSLKVCLKIIYVVNVSYVFEGQHIGRL